MPYTPTRFYGPAVPGTTAAVLVSSGSIKIIKQIVISNTSATATTFTLHLNPNNDTSAAANQLLPAVTIPGNSVLTLDVSLVLNSADTMYGLQPSSPASALVVSIHGVVVT